MGNTHRLKPGEIFIHFKGYIAHTKGKPFEVEDWVGAMATPVKRKKEKPLTMVGFRAYMAWNDLSRNLKDYFNNRDKSYNEYQDECECIIDMIHADQQEGAMAGMFNANFTSKLQGLAEKIETTNVEQPLFPDKP